MMGHAANSGMQVAICVAFAVSLPATRRPQPLIFSQGKHVAALSMRRESARQNGPRGVTTAKSGSVAFQVHIREL